MMSGAASALNIVEAMKNGANDFIPKPLNPDELRKALKTVFEMKSPLPAETPKQAAQPASSQFLRKYIVSHARTTERD